jgi:hypothetical protein
MTRRRLSVEFYAYKGKRDKKRDEMRHYSEFNSTERLDIVIRINGQNGKIAYC